MTDDDTAPEVSVSAAPTQINEGESITFTVTRHGNLDEPLPKLLHLEIAPSINRQISNAVSDTTRGQDHAVVMAAQESEWETTVTVLHDTDDASNFNYRGTLRSTYEIPEDAIPQYYTIRGHETASVSVNNLARENVTFKSITGGFDQGGYVTEGTKGFLLHQTFPEGGEVSFTLQRTGGDPLLLQRELEVTVHYVEPLHPNRDETGTYNPSEQSITLAFPANQAEVTGAFTIAGDTVDESGAEGDARDYMVARIQVPRQARSERVTTPPAPNAIIAYLEDNPQAISISVPQDGDEIDEGDEAEFTLTRHGTKVGELTVRVSIEDPGQFRRGNHGNAVPDTTLPVTFGNGAGTATLTIPTSDDLPGRPQRLRDRHRAAQPEQRLQACHVHRGPDLRLRHRHRQRRRPAGLPKGLLRHRRGGGRRPTSKSSATGTPATTSSSPCSGASRERRNGTSPAWTPGRTPQGSTSPLRTTTTTALTRPTS